MPYAIHKTDGAYEVVNTATGEKHAKHTTHAKAEAQFRLLEGIEHGTIPKGGSNVKKAQAGVRTTAQAAGLSQESKARAKSQKVKGAAVGGTLTAGDLVRLRHQGVTQGQVTGLHVGQPFTSGTLVGIKKKQPVKGAARGVVTTRQAAGLPTAAKGKVCKAAKGTVVERRAARKNYQEAASTSKLGSGPRFKALEASAAASGAKNPGAVAAAAGRKAHGQAAMTKWSRAGRARGK